MNPIIRSIRVFSTSEEALSQIFQANRNLAHLHLYMSPQLLKLPSLPNQLTYLHIGNCRALTSLPKLPTTLRRLVVHNCPRLLLLPELPERLVSMAVDIGVAHNLIDNNIPKY